MGGDNDHHPRSRMAALIPMACDARKCAQQFLEWILMDLSGKRKILKIGQQEAEISPCVKSFKNRPCVLGLRFQMKIKE